MGNLDFSANADQLKELAAYMASQINVPTIGIGGGYAPIGSINFFDATVAPQDWLACDGTVYNIADYPQLADWYEAQHGSKNFYGGNGTTTFAVPDLSGEFLRGAGNNSHTNQGNGAAVGEHQDGTEEPTIGLISTGATTIQKNKQGTYGVVNADSAYARSGAKAFNADNDFSYTDEQVVAQHTSRPTNTSFLICVKAVVAGDVYSTEEIVVGTWIDGKKIYQKTVETNKSFVTTNPSWITEIADVSTLNIQKLLVVQPLTSIGHIANVFALHRIVNGYLDGYYAMSGVGTVTLSEVTIQYTKMV